MPLNQVPKPDASELSGKGGSIYRRREIRTLLILHLLSLEKEKLIKSDLKGIKKV